MVKPYFHCDQNIIVINAICSITHRTYYGDFHLQFLIQYNTVSHDQCVIAYNVGISTLHITLPCIGCNLSL